MLSKRSVIFVSLLVPVCLSGVACSSGQNPTDDQTQAEEEQQLADKASALTAALAATGNDYPVPAVFVKRWNLLAQTLPQVQIATFTYRAHEEAPRPIADLAGFDFNNAGSVSLNLGLSSMSIVYSTVRGDTKERASYTITVADRHERDGRIHPFAQLCLWEIRSTRGLMTLRSAVDLFGEAAHHVPRQAEAEGVRLTLTKDVETSTCEVEEVDK